MPGTEHSRLLKRERPRDDTARAGGESSGSDASDASDAEDAEAEMATLTFGRKQSWPNKALMPSTTPPPKASYGPIHPLDQARLDAERIAKAERDALAGDGEKLLQDDGKTVADATSETARAVTRAALAAQAVVANIPGRGELTCCARNHMVDGRPIPCDKLLLDEWPTSY